MEKRIFEPKQDVTKTKWWERSCYKRSEKSEKKTKKILTKMMIMVMMIRMQKKWDLVQTRYLKIGEIVGSNGGQLRGHLHFLCNMVMC